MSRYADQLPIIAEPTAANYLIATDENDPRALVRIAADGLGSSGGGGSNAYTIIDETALDVDSNLALTAGLYLYVGTAPANFNLSGLQDGERVEIINHTAHKVYLFGFTNWLWNGLTTALETGKGLILEKGGLIGAKYNENLLLFNTLPNGLIADWGIGLRPPIADYFMSQSGVYAPALTATFANMRDGLGTTGGATLPGASWIKASFYEPVLVSSILLGGGSLAGWGGVAFYLNTRTIQYSNDDLTWTNLLTIAGVTDSGINQFKEFGTGGITARYWRINGSNYVATTQFKFS